MNIISKLFAAGAATIGSLLPFGTGDPIVNEPPDVDNGYGAIVGADIDHSEPTMTDPEGGTVEAATLFVHVNPVSTSNHVIVVTLTPEQAQMIVDAANGVASSSDVWVQS